MAGIIVAHETRDTGDFARALAEWLQVQLPDATDIRVVDVDYPRGAGQSHETILFDALWTERGEPRTQGLVVRIKPGRFTVFPDNLFEEQYRVMRVLHDGGYVPVAEPLWYEADSAVLGAPFFVMEKKLGRVPVSVPPYAQSGWVVEATPEERRRMWEQGVRQLAAVQTVPLAEVDFLAGPPHARDGLAQEWDKYTRFVKWVQEDRPLPVLDAAVDRLRDRWPDNQPPGMVWGDARIGNMMFDDDFRLVAVMDWEQPSLGGVLNDLAWWLTLAGMMHEGNDEQPSLEGILTRHETLALWEQQTGISSRDIEWYEEFTHLKIACLGIRMSSLRGGPPPDEGDLATRLQVG